MPGIATSRNLSMDIAGLIGRASGAGKSSILDAAAVRAFTSTLTDSEVASLISAAVGAIDLSGYLPLTGGTLTGSLTVEHTIKSCQDIGFLLGRFLGPGSSGLVFYDSDITQLFGSAGVCRLQTSGVTTQLASDGVFGFASGAAESTPIDTPQIRVSAGETGFRNGTSAQKLRIDKTYTSDTNCEYLRVGWTGSNFDITSEVGSAGGSNQPVRIGRKNAAGTFAGVSITTTGRLTWSAGVGFIDPDCPFELRSTRITDSGGNVRLETTGGLFLGTSRLVTWSSSANSFGAAAVGLSGLSTGVLEINNGTAGTYRDLICRDATLVPSASRTLGTNGQFAIEMTSNTAGNLVYRGSDGTTRRFAFTVS